MLVVLLVNFVGVQLVPDSADGVAVQQADRTEATMNQGLVRLQFERALQRSASIVQALHTGIGEADVAVNRRVQRIQRQQVLHQRQCLVLLILLSEDRKEQLLRLDIAWRLGDQCPHFVDSFLNVHPLAGEVRAYPAGDQHPHPGTHVSGSGFQHLLQQRDHFRIRTFPLAKAGLSLPDVIADQLRLGVEKSRVLRKCVFQ